jgi:hypothetical protein
MEDLGAGFLPAMGFRSFLHMTDDSGFDIWTEDVVPLDS